MGTCRVLSYRLDWEYSGLHKRSRGIMEKKMETTI